MADEVVKKKKDPYATVKQLMREFAELQTIKADIEGIIAEACEDENEEIKEIDKHIRKLQVQREVLLASMQEKEPSAYEDLTKVQSDLARKEQVLKLACYTIPLDVGRKGFKLKEGQISISVAKSTTTVAYSEHVLDDHPEFDELYADGDPLVMRKINPVILDRLVADGVIDAKTVAEFRIETRARNPSVRIEMTEKG